ncbi:hypothetical protein GPJ59_19985, partial [Streptomyces bambusae]|nr:hypothetical protein [Streptomyces bambusae]
MPKNPHGFGGAGLELGLGDVGAGFPGCGAPDPEGPDVGAPDPDGPGSPGVPLCDGLAVAAGADAPGERVASTPFTGVPVGLPEAFGAWPSVGFAVVTPAGAVGCAASGTESSVRTTLDARSVAAGPSAVSRATANEPRAATSSPSPAVMA